MDKDSNFLDIDHKIKLEKQLINNIPEYYREHPNVQDLFSALGEYLDDLRKMTEAQKYAYDYSRSNSTHIDIYLDHVGVGHPRNLSRERRRVLARDIISIYRSHGTEEAMKLIFRLIGWNVEIEYIFIENENIKEEYVYPDDYYFGNDYIDDDGYIKADVENHVKERFSDALIYGEDYPEEYYESEKLELIRTPYFKVNITSEDYAAFTEPYEDEDGNTYRYTEAEQFDIVQDIIDFFYDQARPANTAIIELATSWKPETEIDPLEDFNTPLNRKLDFKQLYGDTVWYGDVSPDTFANGYTFTQVTWDNWNDNMELDYDPPEETITRVYRASHSGEFLYIPLRMKSEVEISGPDSMDVDILVSESSHFDLQRFKGEFEEFEKVSSPTSFEVNDKMALKPKINKEHDEDIEIKVTLKNPNHDLREG